MESIAAPDKADVLRKSLFAAAGNLGLSRKEVGDIVGRDRSTIERRGIEPGTKQGQLALMFIRIYRSLYALMGGDQENMRHFLSTPNSGTGGIPREQLHDIQGMVTVCSYLDAMRGKG